MKPSGKVIPTQLIIRSGQHQYSYKLSPLALRGNGQDRCLPLHS